MCLLYMQFIISHILLAYAINGLQVPNPVFIIVASPLRSIQPWLLVRINLKKKKKQQQKRKQTKKKNMPDLEL